MADRPAGYPDAHASVQVSGSNPAIIMLRCPQQLYGQLSSTLEQRAHRRHTYVQAVKDGTTDTAVWTIPRASGHTAPHESMCSVDGRSPGATRRSVSGRNQANPVLHQIIPCGRSNGKSSSRRSRSTRRATLQHMVRRSFWRRSAGRRAMHRRRSPAPMVVLRQQSTARILHGIRPRTSGAVSVGRPGQRPIFGDDCRCDQHD